MKQLYHDSEVLQGATINQLTDDHTLNSKRDADSFTLSVKVSQSFVHKGALREVPGTHQLQQPGSHGGI